MLDRNWLSTCAPIGTFCPEKKLWKALGAGVFVYDEPFIWYVTAQHLFINPMTSPLHILVNHSKTKHCLIDTEAIHKHHQLEWIVDSNNDLAATLFPPNPELQIKAIPLSSMIQSTELIPSMRCYSAGCPYSLAGFDIEKVNVFILDGIISSLDLHQNRIYVTVPTFPGNSGGPLFVCKEPMNPYGGINVGSPVVHLGGIISEYIVVGGESSLPPLHLGVVIPAEQIRNLLESSKAVSIKKRMHSL